MRLLRPQLSKANGEIRLSAKVVLDRPEAGVPDEIWFSLPEQFESYVSDRADAFAAASLVLAMQLGEDLHVDGALSPRLAFGMDEYQRVMHFWNPAKFKHVRVSAEEYSAPQIPVGAGVGSSFSGGVDSFYTLWQHLPGREPIPGYAVSHLLFIQGFDIPLNDMRTFDTARTAYAQMADDLGMELVTVRTNLMAYMRDWEMSNGSALTSVILLLGGLFTRFYIASSHTYRDLLPWGSHPLLDSHLSTETLDIIHDRADVTRVEKTASIADWPYTFDRLRVCWKQPNGVLNCCRCEKCIRTMATLEMAGALKNYTTFPEPLRRNRIRKTIYRHEGDRAFVYEMMNMARSSKRNELNSDFRYALLRSRVMYPLQQFVEAARVRLALRTRLRSLIPSVGGAR